MAENEKMAKAGAKKTEKAGKKNSVFARAGRWLRELRSELKKVQWPSAKQTVKNTLTVIACVIIVGVFIWIFDFIASGLIQALIKLFH